MKHTPRKRFGQNFLTDYSVIHRIISAIDPQSTDTIVEIGPGTGAITCEVISACNNVHAIEIDRDLCQQLANKFKQLHLHQADILQFEFNSLPDTPLRVIGNLPYNISTTLLFKLFSEIDRFSDLHFMLQKEVSDRLCATPGNKNYGRLTIQAQYRCEIEKLFDIEPSAFHPQPKVLSSFIRLIPRSDKPQIVDQKLFAKVTKLSFSQRRKTISNNLKGIISKQQLADLGIANDERAEQLSVAQYVTISNYLANL